jgi:hypothetical protein
MPVSTRAAAPRSGRPGSRTTSRTAPRTAPRPPVTGRRGRGRPAAAATPLGSLTQREHRSGGICRGCGSTRVTRLSLNLTDGTPVEFTSCHRCEHRTWEHAGAELSVGSVLDRARRQ